MKEFPVIYEVSIKVREDLRMEYETYKTTRHIPDLLATGAFTRIEFLRSNDGRYRVLYWARDRNTLDRYFADDAPRLRSNFQKHFPEGIEIERDEWHVLREWHA